MAPTAVEIRSETTVTHNNYNKPTSGRALVIGTLNSAQDGSYQSLISDLASNGGDVERQLLDRITDSAVVFTPSSFEGIYLHLTASDYAGLESILPSFFADLSLALASSGILSLSNAPADLVPFLSSELEKVGVKIQFSNTSTLSGRKLESPTSSKPVAALSLRSRRAPLTAEQKQSKKAIWAISPSPHAKIDPNTLLTPEDKVRPIPTCAPPDANGAVKRKRACKGCTCGLAELEAEEAASMPVVVLDTSADKEGGEVRQISQDDRERLREAAKNAGKATSSCGSCFLGDAFRCAGCPYLGLPAFQPGQKVEIDFGMDDI